MAASNNINNETVHDGVIAAELTTVHIDEITEEGNNTNLPVINDDVERVQVDDINFIEIPDFFQFVRNFENMNRIAAPAPIIINNEQDREDYGQVREDGLRQIEEVRNRAAQLPTYLLAANREDIQPHDLGVINCTCEYCGAKFFTDERNCRERYTNCCSQGNVVLPPLQPLPEILHALYTDMHPYSRTFMRDILKYNNAFQFSSCEATLRDPPPGRGPMLYSIQGKMLFHIADVNINNQENAKYGPVYFLEPDQAINQRNVNQHLNANREHNPFAQGKQFIFTFF